eukprot:CAMPEP_0205943694 /NCGR_PEP_ID=MMETSP1325-20131115/61192_1 /ASSEMBLY_ACC=CAM_ASM_000708 /TAXON_ID=236786 /ORGANISM="Florenciella sp., Strain RCC1007" /LENGTH=57 /DNA_ID=CAMNT_0053314537 /DNA_START=13 /DNA_END=186 /DNA_ORIENTATION=-
MTLSHYLVNKRMDVDEALDLMVAKRHVVMREVGKYPVILRILRELQQAESSGNATTK